ncbi:MAG TPA: ABC transporter ATP-binding protein [Trebonia sp.]|jgi:branched-chain amino acid transport system ATP-binding protein|nr:ABC transporter ATP-binding protein [Trebonia sp.]
MLSTESVRVSYGSVVALDDVTLEVAPGSIHGVIGPNGAGKSTLMNVLSGAARPRQGRILLEGLDISGKSIRWRRRHGLSRSFQRTSIFPGLTIREQLGLAARGDDAQIARIARVFGLDEVLDARADTTSYGDQRRVDIALAAVGRAKVLLLDEPAAGLTGQETADLFRHVASLVRDEGLTALIVEHDVDAIFSSCDIVTVLDLGRVLMTGTPAVVRADPRVITAYLGTAA